MLDVASRLGPALSDRYRIEREIGAGGMATVYLAHDVKHDRPVALKVLRPELAAVLGAERFLNEIRISARLDHPHILTLIDSGSADGFLYYVMPFVRGESLRSRLDREKQLGVDEALAITRQVGSALEYAHRQGVVHRDIKPENILLHEGEATLADFGIAMAVKEAGGNRLTETGLSLGTPQYMSPEQATGDRTLDARSDVYSLAAVLYEMLAGEPPHSGVTVQAIIAKLMTERPTRLRVMRDTVPEGIDSAVAKALAKIPADRYANAGDFGRALESGSKEPARRAQHPWMPIAAGFAGVAIVSLAVFALLRGMAPKAYPAPDRVQLTTSGNAFSPSLSPDGNRLAFSEKQCDSENNCTWQLVIQDIDGTGRLAVTRGIAGLGNLQWTRDGRFIVYDGSYGSDRWGSFAISSLGGSPRYLGCCASSILDGDTVLIIGLPADSAGMIRLVSIRDGLSKDSIPVRTPGVGSYAWRTDDPDRLLLMTQAPNLGPTVFRLIDREGRVVSRQSFTMEVGGREWTSAWLSGRREFMVGVQRDPGSKMHDFFRISIGRDDIGQKADTIMRGVELSRGGTDVASDLSRLVYASGPFERAVLAMEYSGTGLGPPTQLMTSTTPIWGRISPDGTRMAIVRPIRSGDRQLEQIFISPVSGGNEAPLGSPVQAIADFEWNPNGSGLIYIAGSGAGERSVIAVDTAGTKVLELGRFGPGVAGGVQLLPDNRFILIPAEGTKVSLFSAEGKLQAGWNLPQWINHVERFSAAPDGRAIAAMGWGERFDSVVVARIDVGSGRFTRLAAFGGEFYGRIKWLRDGDLIFDIAESQGARGLYRMAPDGSRLRRIGSLPRMFGSYTVSDEGAIVAFVDNEKSDVYMIRNLGEILRR